MKKLFTQEELDRAKPMDLMYFECYYCGKSFSRTKTYLIYNWKRKRGNVAHYCSNSCQMSNTSEHFQFPCLQCGIEVIRTPSKIEPSGQIFCSRSCAATYHNTHKTQGTRRSKLEIWLEQELTKLYDFEIYYGRKDAINSELDIYIPSLRLAFELNGIFHYEPIFGEDKLLSTQNNDQRKFQACIERGIEFCIIDTSRQKRFTVQSSQMYLDIIKQIIDRKLESP